MHPHDHDFVYSKLSHKTRMYESMLNAASLSWRGSKRRGAVDISVIRIVSLCRGIVMVLVVLLARRVSVQISELLTSLSLATCPWPWDGWREQTHACVSSLHGEINDNVKLYSIQSSYFISLLGSARASYSLGIKLCHQIVIKAVDSSV